MGGGIRLGIAVAFAVAWAENAYADEPQQNYDEAAVSAALAQTPGPKAEKPAGVFEVPPPPPRKKGFVLENQIGAMGFIGELNKVSPTASRFSIQFGFEPLRWLMVFGEGDLAFTSTRYSPPSRGYAIYGFGGGARLTQPIGDRFAVYGQGDIGFMRTSTDVLHTYGFLKAENFNVYFGGLLGFEWYQMDPHYALVVSGGVRKTPGLSREVTGDKALAWMGSAGLRYTF